MGLLRGRERASPRILPNRYAVSIALHSYSRAFPAPLDLALIFLLYFSWRLIPPFLALLLREELYSLFVMEEWAIFLYGSSFQEFTHLLVYYQTTNKTNGCAKSKSSSNTFWWKKRIPGVIHSIGDVGNTVSNQEVRRGLSSCSDGWVFNKSFILSYSSIISLILRKSQKFTKCKKARIDTGSGWDYQFYYKFPWIIGIEI